MSSQESIRKARARALQAGRNAEAPEAARPGRNLLVPGAAIAVGIGGVSAAVVGAAGVLSGFRDLCARAR